MKIRRGSVRLTEQDLLNLIKKFKVKQKPKEQPVLATAK